MPAEADNRRQRDGDQDEYVLDECQPPPSPPPDVTPDVDINAEWERNYRAETDLGQSFTVREMMIGTAVCAVVFACLARLPKGAVAMSLGMLVIIGFLYVHIGGPKHRLVQLVVWLLLILYATVSLVAVIGVWRTS